MSRTFTRAAAWIVAGLVWVPAGFVLSAVLRGLFPTGPDLGTALANLAVAAPAGLPLALAAWYAHRKGLRWGLAAALVLLAPMTLGTTLIGGLLGPVAIYLYALILSLPLWLLPWAKALVLRLARRIARGIRDRSGP